MRFNVLTYLLGILLVTTSSFSFYDGDPHKDGIIILEGKYQNRNIYIANPQKDNGIGYCTYEVRVNGDIITDEVNSKAFEIDLKQFELEAGEEVEIVIKHKGGCAPKVLNPGGLKPKPTFNTEAFEVSQEGLVTWSTSNEAGSLAFKVQQYKWNKWVDIGEVSGIGTPEINHYSFKTDLISGDNKFRVMQRNYEGKIKKSTSVIIQSERPKLTFVYNSRGKEIVFSDDTQYEVHDAYGRIVKRGYGNLIDVSDLKKDDYYLSFDNSTDQFSR